MGIARTEAAVSTRAKRFVVLMDELGFRPLPYLDPNVLIYEGVDGSVSMFGSVVAEDALHVDASDSVRAHRIAEILCDNLGARRFG